MSVPLSPEQIQDIMNVYQSLQQEVASLRIAVSQNQQSRANAPVVPNPIVSAPRTAMPARYDGDRFQFRAFVSQCRLFLRLNEGSYTDEFAKVAFMLTLLDGPARAWAAPLIETNDAVLRNIEQFLALFQAAFDDPDRARTAELSLQGLKQGIRSVSVYASEFRRIATDTQWNDSALMHQFRLGLTEEMKD